MDGMAAVGLDTRAQRKAEVPWKQLEDTIVVLDLATGDFFELDELGSRIWSGLDGTRSLRELVADLGREYDATPDRIGSDAIAFLTDLHTRGLVTIA